ncbi:MAG TPA: hypothetical protein PKE40_07645 [Arachnia sp.]|nr:hypothetical protein [Arachnia sp.]HMT86208.1 hypothetical protein [Arachnia sp.]
MIAIWILAGLGLAGAIALAVYASGLRHKAAALRHEIGVTRGRLAPVGELASQLEIPGKRA